MDFRYGSTNKSCNIDNFKKMEDIVLKKISQIFSEGLIELFDDTYSHRKNIISSLLRSTDLVHELNNEEGEINARTQ